MPTPPDFQRPPFRKDKPKSNRLRTTAIVAGNAGLAIGGLKIAQAADQIRRTAAVAEQAADNTRAITGAIRSPLKALRKTVRFSVASVRKDTIHFASPGSVAQDRYRKQIKEADTGHAASAYHRSAGAGALLGLALRKPGMTRGKAAGLGALAGAGVQAITRQASATTKDNFGERSPGGKKLDALPAVAITAGALLAGRRKLPGLRRLATGKVAGKVAAAKKAAPKMAGAFVKEAAGNAASGFFGFSTSTARLKKALIGGGALAGGITVADSVSALTERKPGQSTGEALAHGAAKGAIYGTVLAGSEPILHSLLKRVPVRKFSTRRLRKEIQFGGRQQLRDDANRYVDPLKVASGEASAYVDGDRLHLPVQHAQVVRAAINKGQSIHRTGTRVGALLKDAVGAASGQPKVDARGRTQKREWEKSWFKNAVGTAATAGALLGHASLMKKNPAYRKKVAGVVRAGKSEANKFVPDLFPMSAKRVLIRPGDPLYAHGVRELRFDETQGDWDIRDARGKSARVFAPGSQRRQRREKKTHETVGFLRKAAVVGSVLAAAGGTALGYKLGTRRSALRKITPAAPAARIIPFPVQA